MPYVTRPTQTFLDRISLYLARTKADLEQGDYSQALADCAELSEIARRFWLHLEMLAKARR
jgi:hypothetical protein